MYWVTKILKNVKGIKIKNVKTNKTQELKLDGVFIAIGHDPATQLCSKINWKWIKKDT